MSNFELYDSERQAHELYRMVDRRAVVIFTFSPTCDKELPDMIELKTAPGDVAWLGLDAARKDSREAIERARKRRGITAPVLRDPAQVVARELGLEAAFQTVVIDTQSWKVAHKGSLQSARLAVAEILAGRVPEAAAPVEKNCPIHFEEQNERITYVKEIAPIFKAKCLSCHSERGQFPPFFSDYESVQSWAAMIRLTVMTEKMPVWGIDSDPGEFHDDASLSPKEKSLLVRWLDAGLPRGEGSDPLVGYVPEVNDTPREGASYVAEQERDVDVPPEGFNEYRYFQLGGPLPRDMWVGSVEGFSTNARAMHHAALTVMPKPLAFYLKRAEEMRKAMGDEDPARTAQRWLGAAMRKSHELEIRKMLKTNPGSPLDKDEWIRIPVYSTYGRSNSRRIPPSSVRFLPKGWYLILETHHNGTGKPEKERTKVYFYEKEKKAGMHSLHRLDLYDVDVRIPPRARDFRVKLPDFVARRDLYLLSCNPHIHIRGRALHAWAELPGGKRRHVIAFPSLFYDWHSGVVPLFTRPIFLPKGSVLKSYITIDNSPLNPFNPDPDQEVLFGQRLREDEMPKLQCLYHYVDD